MQKHKVWFEVVAVVLMNSKFCVMWHYVTGWGVPGVSERFSAFFVRVKQAKKKQCHILEDLNFQMNQEMANINMVLWCYIWWS